MVILLSKLSPKVSITSIIYKPLNFTAGFRLAFEVCALEVYSNIPYISVLRLTENIHPLPHRTFSCRNFAFCVEGVSWLITKPFKTVLTVKRITSMHYFDKIKLYIRFSKVASVRFKTVCFIEMTTLWDRNFSKNQK